MTPTPPPTTDSRWFDPNPELFVNNEQCHTYLITKAMLDIQRKGLEQGKPALYNFQSGLGNPVGEGFALEYEKEIHDLAISIGAQPLQLTGITQNEGPAFPVKWQGAPTKFIYRGTFYKSLDTAISCKINGSHQVQITIMTLRPDVMQAILNLSTKYNAPTEIPNISLLIQSQNGLTTRTIQTPFQPLTQDNYTPQTLKDLTRIQEALEATNPVGRLTILDGPQGTGKTYFIRGLIKAIKPDKCLFLFIPPNLVASLSGPQILPLLLDLSRQDQQKIVLVIEDADEALVKRDGTNETEVSTLLNLSDGILGELFDIRIICTTNRKMADLPLLGAAIKRPGRLVCHSHLGALSPDHAQRIYQRLTEGKPVPQGELTKDTYLANVYALALDNGWQPDQSDKKTPLGFTPPQKCPDSKYIYSVGSPK